MIFQVLQTLQTQMMIGWLSGFFKAGFSLILHALLAVNNHSGRNFKNLNKTSAVCIKLESDPIFMILDSFCRELWGVSNDVKITKITQQTMKITQYYKSGRASMLGPTGRVGFWKLGLTWPDGHPRWWSIIYRLYVFIHIICWSEQQKKDVVQIMSCVYEIWESIG